MHIDLSDAEADGLREMLDRFAKQELVFLVNSGTREQCLLVSGQLTSKFVRAVPSIYRKILSAMIDDVSVRIAADDPPCAAEAVVDA